MAEHRKRAEEAREKAAAQIAQATNNEDIWVRGRAIQALGRVKTEKAAEAVAAQMYRNRGEACQVLAEIGGAESLKALREYGKRATGFDVQHADKAIAAIEKRLAEARGSEESPATAEAKPASRTWRDASGLFEVEATLVEFDGTTARLKRNDGRIISVPLEKLSEADQTYLRGQAKGQ